MQFLYILDNMRSLGYEIRTSRYEPHSNTKLDALKYYYYYDYYYNPNITYILLSSNIYFAHIVDI